MPVNSRQIIRRLKDIGFNPVSQNSTSHIKLKDVKGNVIVLPNKKGKDVKMGVVWNINRTLARLEYPQLNFWK